MVDSVCTYVTSRLCGASTAVSIRKRPVRGFTPQNLSAVLRSLYNVLLVASPAPPSQLRTSSVTSREPQGLKANLSTIGGTCTTESQFKSQFKSQFESQFRSQFESDYSSQSVQCSSSGRVLRCTRGAASHADSRAQATVTTVHNIATRCIIAPFITNNQRSRASLRHQLNGCCCVAQCSTMTR
jgi:hypothetical protein